MYNTKSLQSEKKYDTKAAQEYKRHLMKLVHESSAHGNVSPPATSREQDNKQQLAGAKWNSSTGLDSIIQSMSGANLADLGSSSSSSSTEPPLVISVPVPPPQPTPPAAQEDEEVEGEVQEGDEDAREERREEVAQVNKALANDSATPTGVLKVSIDVDASAPQTTTTSKSNLMKKPMSGPPRKITSVAKKIVSKNPNSTDIVLESFEATDRRLAKQSEAATATATSATSTSTAAATAGGINGSSRLAAAYSDSLATEKEGPSIYRTAPVTTNQSNASGKVGGGIGSGGFSSSSVAAGESTMAREKYGKAKGISSDQFFGDPVAEARDREARSKLSHLSGSTSISSDMLRGDGSEDADAWGSGNSNSAALDVSALGRWTQDLIKRIG